MTQLQLVRRYFPRASGAQADYILWSMTAFPCNGCEGAEEQLAELRAKVGNTRARGWLRKLGNEARRLDAEMESAMRAASLSA